jgi:hypothetical protein
MFRSKMMVTPNEGDSFNTIVRDIVYLFHVSADYEYIWGDNDYWSLLRGHYYTYFEEGEGWDNAHLWVNNLHRPTGEDDEESGRTPNEFERFVQVGSVLLFLSMLCDWEQGSGYAFGTHDGECRHSLPLYVRSALRAYRRVRTMPDHPTRPAYIAVLVTLSTLEHKKWPGSGISHLETRLDNPELLAEVRELINEDGLDWSHDQWVKLMFDVYDIYVRSYFAERAKPRESQA